MLASRTGVRRLAISRPETRLGPCEITSLLGAGGTGKVYRARDPRLGREVALKVLSDPRVADRLLRLEQAVSMRLKRRQGRDQWSLDRR